jgi:hypothetical protein
MIVKPWKKLENREWDKNKSDWTNEAPYDGKVYSFRNRYVDYDTCYYYDPKELVFRNAHGVGHCCAGFLIENGAEWIEHWGLKE